MAHTTVVSTSFVPLQTRSVFARGQTWVYSSSGHLEHTETKLLNMKAQTRLYPEQTLRCWGTSGTRGITPFHVQYLETQQYPPVQHTPLYIRNGCHANICLQLPPASYQLCTDSTVDISMARHQAAGEAFHLWKGEGGGAACLSLPEQQSKSKRLQT